MAGLKFNEFMDKLQQLKSEFEQENGRKAETVAELEAFLKKRQFRAKGRRHLTSLKGFNI